MKKETIKSEIEVSEFAENLIDTVREPLLVLDQDLRVVKASRSFYDYFKVNPAETIGKLIYNLGNDQWDIPKLRELLESILPEKTTFENYEVEHDFATIGKRIMLLNARQIERALGKDKLILLAIEDITDRKLLENLLTESEERFRRVFETADDGILLLEKAGFTIRYANQSITKLSGYSIEDCTGKKLTDIGFPADLKTSQVILQTLEKNGIFHYKDAVIQNKTGQLNDVDIYMVDKTHLVQCNIRDITERKRVEKALQEKSFNLNERDKELNCLYKISQLVETPNLSDDDFFQGVVALIPAALHYPDITVSRLVVYDKEYKTEKFKKSAWNFHRDIIIKEKKVGSIEIHQLEELSEIENKQFLKEEEDLLKAIAEHLGHIIERKQAEKALKESEKKFKIITESSADAIFIVDKEGKYLYVNKQCVDLLGYTKEEFLTFTIADISPKNRIEEYFQIFQQLLITGSSYSEIELVKKDGSYAETDLNAVLLPNGWIYGSCRDISERKKAEKALQESEEKFRTIFENKGTAAVLFGEDGIIRDCNSKFSELSGIKKADIIDKMKWSDFVVKEDLERLQQYHAKRLEQGDPLPTQYECGIINTSGKILHVIVNISLMGTTRIVTLTDITERKQTEEALKNSEKKYRYIFESIQDVYYEIDLEGTILEISPSIEVLSQGQYTRDELLGKKMSDYYLKPEARDEFIQALLKHKRLSDYEIILKNRDGSPITCSISSMLQFDSNSKPEKIIGSMRDITARKLGEEALRTSEAQLSNAMEIAKLGYWEYDVDSDLFTFNDQFYHIFRTTAEKVGGYKMSPAKYAELFLYPDDRELVGHEMQKAFTTTDPNFSQTLEHRIIYTDGEIGYISVRYFIVKDNQGRTIKTFGANQDITEHKLAEEQIKQDLIEKNALIQEIYHRTKNNMQVIISMLRMQSHTLGNQKESEQTGITFIQEAFSEIINRINSMSLVHHKLCQGQDLSQINLKNYIEDLVNQLKLSFLMNYSRISLNLELQEIYVMIDTAVPLGLILNELISNVFKHAFPDETKGEISIRLYKDENDAINIQVNDNGIGIPADLDLRNLPSMGVKIIFNLVESQLKGVAEYSIDHGLKWHIKVSEAKIKKRI